VTPQDAADIEASANALLTSEDPSVCTEIVTDGFLESVGLDLERCKRQQKVEYGTKSLKVSNVEGVPGVLATAEVVAKGGPASGDRSEMTFVYEDGTWKVDAYTKAPPPEATPET
jgi:hypothetical protein